MTPEQWAQKAFVERRIGLEPIAELFRAAVAEVERERDALAAQVEEMRKAGHGVLVEFAPKHLDSVSGSDVGTRLEAALALPLTRAEKVAEARRNLCRAVGESTIVLDSPVEHALDELRKVEEGKP